MHILGRGKNCSWRTRLLYFVTNCCVKHVLLTQVVYQKRQPPSDGWSFCVPRSGKLLSRQTILLQATALRCYYASLPKVECQKKKQHIYEYLKCSAHIRLTSKNQGAVVWGYQAFLQQMVCQKLKPQIDGWFLRSSFFLPPQSVCQSIFSTN